MTAKSANYKDLIQKNKAIAATYKLYEIILENLEFKDMMQRIADVIPQKLGYETGVLALVDKRAGYLKRVAISRTSGGSAALKSLEIPFEDIDIPLNDKNNLGIKAIDNRRQYISHNLYDLVGPTISKENALEVQTMMGITTSIVNPIILNDEPIGIFIVSMSKGQKDLSHYEREMISRFVEGIGIAIEKAQTYKKLKTATGRLKTANKKLKQLDKQKDEFISIASHELKTPISIANNNLWMFKKTTKYDFTKNELQFLNDLEGGLARMQKIVNNLLDISRMQDGRLVLDVEECDLCELLCSSLKNFEQLSQQKNIELKIPEKTGEMPVTLDGPRIQEVFENLISNAIKYTQDGVVSVDIEDKGETYKICVIDTGPGIKKEDKEKIFEKFGRATEGLKLNQTGASTGLGLYIAKSYTEEMGGKIGFESEFGKGTTFWIEIPKTVKVEKTKKKK